MQLQYTYWQENDGWYLGYLNDYPEHWTQGKTICELEEMLADLYELQQEESTTPPQAAGYVVSPEELHSGVHTPPQVAWYAHLRLESKLYHSQFFVALHARASHKQQVQIQPQTSRTTRTKTILVREVCG